MVERCFAFFQFHRDRVLELTPLFLVQNRVDGGHVACQSGDGQVGPAMATGNVVQASVLAVGIVESNPASEMGKRLSSRPVRIVLMPGDHTAVMRRLAEELIVPKADGSA